MKWRNPRTEQLPEKNQIVWVLMEHPKENGALSCEIYCGEVEYNNDLTSCRAFNNDWIGAGSASWTLWALTHNHDIEYAKAWCPVEEIPLPKF